MNTVKQSAQFVTKNKQSNSLKGEWGNLKKLLSVEQAAAFFRDFLTIFKRKNLLCALLEQVFIKQKAPNKLAKSKLARWVLIRKMPLLC